MGATRTGIPIILSLGLIAHTLIIIGPVGVTVATPGMNAITFGSSTAIGFVSLKLLPTIIPTIIVAARRSTIATLINVIPAICGCGGFNLNNKKKAY
jgi:ABC-type transport system involved in cytochrome c biogenesis permease component